MEGLLTATKVSSQLVLEQLCSALLLFSECLKQLPGLSMFSWELLICTGMVVFIVKSSHTLMREREIAKGVSAYVLKAQEKIGLNTPAYKSLQSPGAKASPLTLQALCLAALNKHLNSSSLVDTEDLLEKEQKSEAPNLSSYGTMMADLQGQTRLLKEAAESHQSHMTDEKNILKASHKTVEHIQKKIRDGVKENTYLQESLQVLAQEIAVWEQKVCELKEQIEMLEHCNIRMNQDEKDKDRHIKSLTEIMLKKINLPDILRQDYMDDGNLELDQQKKLENGKNLVYQSSVDLNKFIDVVNLHISFKRLEGEKREIFKNMCEENQMNTKLTGQIGSLQNEKASLLSENAHLKNEIQKLQMKLEILPEVHQKHVMQLHANSVEVERYCSEMEKKLRKVYGSMNFTYQKRNLYKKMAEDLDKELQRTTSFYNQIVFDEKKVQESGLASHSTERKLNELRKENYNREMLAKVELKAQFFPGGPYAPAVPPTTSEA